MLIDEPDAHLHPDKQERLIEALEGAAAQFSTQILMSTHSPYIVRAASADANLIWMQHGKVQADDDEAIRRHLGWGGLDKSLLFFAEDEDDKPLRAIVRQWPELYHKLSICRCFGIENLPRDKLLEGLLVDGNLKMKAIIHRDGDFLTQDEAKIWQAGFKTRGVYPWVTAGSDMEGYFCTAEYLSKLYNITVADANTWRAEAAQSINKARETFMEKRRNIVRTIWPDGGSPNADDLWTGSGGKSPETVKGKSLHKALKVVARKYKCNDRLLDRFAIPRGHVVAPELKTIIQSAIAGE